MVEVKEKILEVIIRSPGPSLDEIVLECPDLTLNQVCCEIDRMSRMGQIKLMLKGRGLLQCSCIT